jgi:hypothetical protein
MKLKSSFAWLLPLTFSLLPSFALGQTSAGQPQTVSVCDLLKDPKAFSGKNIQIRGTVISEFEVFAVDVGSCALPNAPGIWLMFGGDVDCPTPSTWNDVYRPKGKNVKFDGVEYPLVKDDGFRMFYKAVTKRKNEKSAHKVTATMEGTFFAGDVSGPQGQPIMPGYGHLGCCHLFIIHQISQVDAQKKPTA